MGSRLLSNRNSFEMSGRHCWSQCRLATKPSTVSTKHLRLSISATRFSADSIAPWSLASRARMSATALPKAGVLSSRSVIAIFNCCLASAFRTSGGTAPLGSAERFVFKPSNWRRTSPINLTNSTLVIRLVWPTPWRKLKSGEYNFLRRRFLVCDVPKASRHPATSRTRAFGASTPPRFYLRVRTNSPQSTPPARVLSTANIRAKADNTGARTGKRRIPRRRSLRPKISDCVKSVAGCGDSLRANIYRGRDVVQLTGVDHVQPLLADTPEPGQNLVHGRRHNSAAALVSGKVQVEVFAHETVGHAGEAIKRILDAVAEQLAAEHVVIERNAQRKLHRRLSAFPEVQVIFPAGVEELPLQVGHLNQLCALFLLHARVFERHEESRNESSPRVTQVVKQFERFFCVCVCLSGQSNDESAEGEPVMLVQDLHSLEHHVAPLMSLIGIGFALHENIEETRTARFQADDRIRHAMIRVSRFFVLHV